MASEVGLAYVRIVPSMKGFSQAASKEMSAGMGTAADAASKKAESRFAKFNKAAKVASAAALAGMAAIGKQSVNLASTQAANFSKFEQVTKQAMDSTHIATARSLNLSRSSYADYFSQLSAMYQSNGIGVKKANKLAAESMKTAADAAAFGNTTVGQAVEAQLGLLKGSGELWEQYSVSIKASDVSARLKAKGLDKLTGEEKKAAEAAAKHALAQEAAKIFLGQAAREADSLESRQQKLKATVDDLGASLGAVLLPAAVAITGKLQTFALWAEKNQGTVKALAVGIGGLAASVWIINGAVKAAIATKKAWLAVSKASVATSKALAAASSGLVRGFTAAATAAGRAAVATGRWAASMIAAAGRATASMVAAAARQVAAWTVMAARAMANAARIAAAWLISLGPIAIVAAAVAGLTVLVVKNWDKIKNAITKAATTVLNFLKRNWPKILAILTGPFGLAVLAIVKNWGRIKSTAAAALNAVKSAFNTFVGFVAKIPGRLGSALASVANKMVAPFRRAFNGIRNLWNSTVGGFGVNIPSVGIGPFKTPGVNFTIPRMHTGGIVPGTGDQLTMLKGGEGVFTKDQLRALGSGAVGGSAATVNVYPTADSRRFIEWLRYEVRTQAGGDAQAFFGQRA